MSSHEETPQLVHDEDEHGKRQGEQPPGRGQGVQADVLGQLGRVDENSGQAGLEDEGEVEVAVGHALVHDGHDPRLADDQVSPLDLAKKV